MHISPIDYDIDKSFQMLKVDYDVEIRPCDYVMNKTQLLLQPFILPLVREAVKETFSVI